jgi:serine phosphatase RsbU (regulator of sigma subunit)/anti-sigma regulatory factor (Ser/Thr protein kinase)/HAMP domain-containing protein
MKSFNSRSHLRGGINLQSLSSVIIVTTYCLMFFSATFYFTTINGQVRTLVLRQARMSQEAQSRQIARLTFDVLESIDPENTGQHSDTAIARAGKRITKALGPDGSEFVIINSCGTVLYSSENRKVDPTLLTFQGFYEWSTKTLTPMQELDLSLRVPDSFHLKMDDLDVAMTVIKGTDLFVGLVANHNIIAARAARLELCLLIALLLTFGVLLVMFILLLRLIMSPLKTLTNAVLRIGRGDLNTRVEIKSSTEIGILANAFNTMAEDLDSKYTEIREYSCRLYTANDDAKRTLDILGKRNKELALINSLSYESSKTFSFRENIEFLIDRITEDYSPHYVEIFVLTDRTREWTCRQNLDNHNYPNDIPPDVQKLLFNVTDKNKVYRKHGNALSDCSETEIPAEEIVLLPIDAGGNTKVVIAIGDKERGGLSSRDISFFKTLVRHAGVILHNARLYEFSLKRGEILEKINSIGQTILSELNLEKLIPGVLRELKGLLNVFRVTLVYADDKKFKMINYSLDEEWNVTFVKDLESDLWCQEVLETASMLLDQKNDKAPDWVWNLYGEEYRSYLGIPLVGNNKKGLLALYAFEPDFFTPEDVRFMNTFANYLSSALSNASLFKEIHERERARTQQLEVAKKFQSDRIPYNFEQGRLEFECSLLPAMELAGDFFDVFSLGSKSVGVVIGDVATKGIPASLMTFSILSLFRNAAKTLTPPNKVMALVNQGLMAQIKETSWFATAFYARIHTDDLIMTFCKAGHVLPILYKSATKEMVTIDTDGVPLGILSDGMFQTGQVKLEEGDRVILYTDGVTELRVGPHEMFGMERLLEIIRKNGEKEISEIKDAIFEELERIGDSRYNRDDILIAVLGIKSDPWINRVVTYEETTDLIDEIMEMIAQYDLERNDVYGIRLSLNETLANAHKHGNRGDPTRKINVEYLMTSERFSLVVRDEGQGFDYEALPDPTVEENLLLPHGRGVFLMRSMMDEVEFNEVGNSVQVSKYFADGFPEDEAQADAEMQCVLA